MQTTPVVLIVKTRTPSLYLTSYVLSSEDKAWIITKICFLQVEEERQEQWQNQKTKQ